MKKIILTLICILFLTNIFYVENSFALDGKQYSNEEVFKSYEDSKEILYQDVAISLLIPYIQKEINNYYKEYLTELPIVFPYSVDIINVKREGGYSIELELIVHPFVGPINIVGDDRIILKTGAFGTVEIKKFEHVKSYPLPWNWKHIIKKVYF
ncbi:hypothetical protein SR42_00080 [Clostridium botulinum]|uniref:DUF3888 domain-containing protein n=1 Tax=Clostridium botulinum TaxID=1491 RepID=UPI000597789D|nr:DUF3888 domain-containing protein [Clostridium botulinum]KIL07491.1 hypothetical protein SR42_00080 [Clostridium botulinum]MBY6935368.1 DUF3888 domain-containing protein [Clostridium botulinum]NFL84162.1 DUF3888 domain-containing protein [Clostridium botulinum]NFN12537.1 DUF3888 domain-containing protein [Clostridium botulinum]NFO37703.1 DUF3888 domain-containing protein [Clostridium botulinum]